MELYAPLSEEKGQSFMVQVASSMPVLGDQDLLFQALANVLDNAIQYTPASGSIRISMHDQPEELQISICDNRPGIPPTPGRQFLSASSVSKRAAHPPATALASAWSRPSSSFIMAGSHCQSPARSQSHHHPAALCLRSRGSVKPDQRQSGHNRGGSHDHPRTPVTLRTLGLLIALSVCAAASGTPDFVDLAQQSKPAASTSARPRPSPNNVRQMGPGSPFDDFFDRFFNGQPGTAHKQRSLGSGFFIHGTATSSPTSMSSTAPMKSTSSSVTVEPSRRPSRARIRSLTWRCSKSTPKHRCPRRSSVTAMISGSENG